MTYLCGMKPDEPHLLYSGLSPQATALLTEHARETAHPRKTLLLSEGERDEELLLVLEGSVRRYVMREERCVLLDFAFEGDAATVTLGSLPGGVSRHCIETMEPTRLLRIPRLRIDLLMAENAELRAELEQVKRERDAAVEDLHKLCPAWKWDGEPSNLLTVPFTAGRQTPGCGLFRLSGSTARRRDRYIGNGGDQNGATDI